MQKYSDIAQHAGDTQIAAIQAAGTTQVGLVQAEGTAGVAAVGAQQTTSVAAVGSAGSTQTTNVTNAGSTAVTNVGNAQTTATSAITTQQTTSVAAVVTQENTSKAAVAAVGAAQIALVIAAVSAGNNRIKNPGFMVNQMGYVSGASITAATYAHDMWKAGAANSAYTFTASGNINIITITAGTIKQIVEGIDIDGGNHTLSWTGTAQCAINGAAAAVSPQTVNLSAGVDVTLEWGLGTMGHPILAGGSNVIPFISRPLTLEEQLCKRYYWKTHFSVAAIAPYFGGATSAWNYTIPTPVTMRGTPSIAFVGSPTTTGTFYVAPTVSYIAGFAKLVYQTQLQGNITIEADVTLDSRM